MAKKKYIVELSSLVLEEDIYFPLLRMKMIGEGLLITAKSPVFGAFFAGIATKTATGKPSTFTPPKDNPWSGGRYFLLESEEWPRHGEDCFYCPGSWDYFESEVPNSLWLTHVDLATGMELVVAQPISLNNFEDYFTSCYTLIQRTYQRKLVKAELSAVLKVQTLAEPLEREV